MYIDKNSPVPVYYQLKNLILEKIRSGQYREGDLLPSERELTAMLKISRMTVRQALNQLVAEGVLRREKGKGTFVTGTKFEQWNIMSFSEAVRKKGLTPGSRILYFQKELPGMDIAEQLDLAPDEAVYRLKRLRLINEEPVGIEENYFPEKYFPNLETFDLTASLYEILQNEYGYIIEFAENTIAARNPSKDEKALLLITGNVPVLIVTSLAFTTGHRRLFFEKACYRSDEYKYNVRVYKNNF